MQSRIEVPHPLPDDLAELIAARFQVLAEPMRIKLLDRLRGGEMPVGRLAEELGTTQQNASKHLVFELCEQVCGGLHRQLAELGQVLTGRVES
jgi:DNA-binding transcriptional ArsR family regulator